MLAGAAGLLSAAAFQGCNRAGATSRPAPVKLYTSADEPLAREVIAACREQTGLEVRMATDTEAGKTTGLVRRIEAERNRPQADVFWSSELFLTIGLARNGLLAQHRPPAEGIPERYRDPEGRWTAFAVRARVVGYNTAQLKPVDLPAKWANLADAKWKGRLAIADPRFGTTGGHMAAMLALWGEPQFIDFLSRLREVTGGKLADGNATAARQVGAGSMAICATDSDDVYARQARGEPVELSYPDMGDGGTLMVPNSAALIAGSPNPEGGRRLLDWLTSPAAERLIAKSESRNIPVRESLRQELGLAMPPETKLAYPVIADQLPRALELAGKHLIARPAAAN